MHRRPVAHPGGPTHPPASTTRCGGARAPPPPDPDHTSPNAPRFEIVTTHIHVFGYPTDQGDGVNVVALEDVSAIDLAFLSLPYEPLNNSIWQASHKDPFHSRPAVYLRFSDPVRLPDQDAENEFCRRLLRLGARRWESLDRFRFVLGAINYDDLVIDEIEGGFASVPTSEERRWVSVAWPAGGGVCIAEIPRRLPDFGEHEEFSARQNLILERRSILRMARNMDEKASMLMETFEGKMYENVGEVDSRVIRISDLREFQESSAAGEKEADLAGLGALSLEDKPEKGNPK
ncbi:hypothetical protein K4K49_003802 [Colletotrichum sp. SAR 10_70]|nr:hypothetical protein K4K50_000206 [Colletotrichum sp. SAR 10_71]KAI8204367.1 hypothetical protein K4K49_003802 [Colletotrichum sp. SAR 10_70]